MQLVTIYYNHVFVAEVPSQIYPDCPYVNMPIEEALDFAENKLETMEWDAYCIPDLCNHEVVFLQKEDFVAEKIQLFVAFSSSARMIYDNDGIEDVIRNPYLQKGHDWDVIEFDTLAEVNAFQLGSEKTLGWEDINMEILTKKEK